jgi:hypothetical protein
MKTPGELEFSLVDWETGRRTKIFAEAITGKEAISESDQVSPLPRRKI